MNDLPEKIEVDREALYRVLIVLANVDHITKEGLVQNIRDEHRAISTLIRNHDDALNAATGTFPPVNPE